MIHFQKKVLDNGLKVIVAPMENTQAVTLLVLVGVGSRYETMRTSGISHFLEHLFFKGTKNRPRPGQIHKELDKIGAEHNAFTSKETTGFWVKTAAKDFEIGLDIVSDILLNPIFKIEEIEKERGVILQELSMYEDEPRMKVWHILENIIYEKQLMGQFVGGTPKTVSQISKGDILNYKEKNYLSKNTVVVAAGNLEIESAFKKITSRFKRIKTGKNRLSKKTEILQKSPNVKIIEKESDQTHAALAFRAYNMFDEKKYPLNLLAVILGGNTSSKLFMEIREKLGWAYYVFALGDQYTDCGYLGLGFGVAHEKLERSIEKIQAILRKIKEKSVSQKELDFAISFVRGQTALKLESTDEIANFCANQEVFYHKILQPEDILKKIEKVSKNDILKIARHILIPARTSLAAIGRHEESKNQSRFYKNLFLRYL